MTVIRHTPDEIKAALEFAEDEFALSQYLSLRDGHERLQGEVVRLTTEREGAVNHERERCAEIVHKAARSWNDSTTTRKVLDGVLRAIATGGQ